LINAATTRQSSFIGWAAPLQSITASEVLAAVNSLRASQGLAAYKSDGGLMAYAQEHAEYMLRIGQGTHQHSDGTSPQAHGYQENIASGTEGYLTVNFIVYTIWADPVHMRTMTGYSSGLAGVGVASNGKDVYVSLDVRPDGGATSSSGSNSTAPTGGVTPVPLIAPVITSTAQADRSVVHTVGFGQSLWQIAIAYGVKINEIRALNGLPADSTTIYEGQRLVIHPPGSVTPTNVITYSPTFSQVKTSDTATPEPSPTRQSPTSTLTHIPVAWTPTPTAEPYQTSSPAKGISGWFELNGRFLLIGLVFLCALVVLIIFLLSFRK
jgi:LysM repeat protein